MKQKYNLGDLLQAQPKTFKKTNNFALLNNVYASDQTLHKVILSANSYRLLNRAKLTYSQLTRLCSLYKIKSNLFFALFVKYKQQYFKSENDKKKNKQAKIEKILSKMSSDKKSLLKVFLTAEKTHNKKVTLWRSYFYNLSYKKAKFFCSSSNLEFYKIADSYLDDFGKKYNCPTQSLKQKLIYFALEFSDIPKDTETIKNKYHQLSKKFHPDVGGNDTLFKLLVEVYNQCLSLSTEEGFLSK
jgi:hypothetical protein